jgi:FkbM family methyltransferase
MRTLKRIKAVLTRALLGRRRLKRAVERRFVMDDKPVILDIGGQIGQSVQRYARLFPGATIHSFEPFPETYSRLLRRAAKYPGAQAHQIALADTPGSRPLHVSPQFSGTNSLLQRPSSGRRYYPRDAELIDVAHVDVTTVDNFCTERGIETIDLMKIDVQGAELLVLKGARGLLEREAISAIICEVAFTAHYEEGVLYHDLARFLGDFGYTLFDFEEGVRARNGQLRYSNALFLSSRLRHVAIDILPEEP